MNIWGFLDSSYQIRSLINVDEDDEDDKDDKDDDEDGEDDEYGIGRVYGKHNV